VQEEAEVASEYGGGGGSGGGGSQEEYPDPGQGVYRLNTQVTKLHNVRGKIATFLIDDRNISSPGFPYCLLVFIGWDGAAEPIKTAKIVGHLLADRDIFVEAEVSPWLKVSHDSWTPYDVW